MSGSSFCAHSSLTYILFSVPLSYIGVRMFRFDSGPNATMQQLLSTINLFIPSELEKTVGLGAFFFFRAAVSH